MAYEPPIKRGTSATTAGQSPSSAPLKPWVEFATGHIKHQWACEVAYFSVLVQRGMRRNMSLAKILAPALLTTRLLKRLPSPFGKSVKTSCYDFVFLSFFLQCQLPPWQFRAVFRSTVFANLTQSVDVNAESLGSDVYFIPICLSFENVHFLVHSIHIWLHPISLVWLEAAHHIASI